MFSWLDLHLWCQTYWDFFENSDLFEFTFFLPKVFLKLLSSARTSFFCILILDMNTYIWCNVSCNVWLCMNEMFEHLNSFFIWICFIPLSSFIILTHAKCKCHAPSHADECPNQPYQCNMQPLCPDMPLINFELLTLMSIFLWMQTKCDASLDFCLWYKCFLTKMQM